MTWRGWRCSWPRDESGWVTGERITVAGGNQL